MTTNQHMYKCYYNISHHIICQVITLLDFITLLIKLIANFIAFSVNYYIIGSAWLQQTGCLPGRDGLTKDSIGSHGKCRLDQRPNVRISGYIF